MSDDNNVQTDDQPQAKRGRSKKEKARRSFAKELQALQARVDMAVRLLKRTNSVNEDGSVNDELVTVALEVLTEG